MISRSKVNSVGGARRKPVDKSGKVSDEVLDFIKNSFNDSIPVPYVTAVTKKYNKQHALHADDKFLQRFVEGNGLVSTKKLMEYLKTPMPHPKHAPLSDEAVKRVYRNWVNKDGQITYDSLMQMGEDSGVPVTEKEAKEMVRLYGRRKQFLSVDDMMAMNKRWNSAKSPPRSRTSRVVAK